MGRHVAIDDAPAAPARRRPAGPVVVRSDDFAPAAASRAAVRRSRLRIPVIVVAFAAAAGFSLVAVVEPDTGAAASPGFAVDEDPYAGQPVQTLAVTSEATQVVVSRDSYSVELPPPPPPPPAPSTPATTSSASSGTASSGAAASSSSSAAPAVSAPDPGSAKAIAFSMLQARGWGSDQYSCLVSLWNRESGWNVHASNRSSGAYGIPQALPGSKMASAGPDWQDNAATQISWGLGYISGRYGTPCGAWGHSQATNWY